MSFYTDLRDFEGDFEELANEYKQKLAIDASAHIIMMTNVDTGTLRFNWQTTLNTSATGKLAGTDDGPVSDDGEGESIAKRKGKGIIEGSKLNEEIWLTNNIEYAQPIEDRTHMVEITVANFKPVAKKIGQALSAQFKFKHPG